uniref:DUF4834 family protein n=1 Tax=Alistipes sp. TaxID=1872444 RepID=UPI004055E823
MNIIMQIVEGLVEFVKRNPLFTLIVVMLAVLAPSALTGIALVVLYFLLGIVLFGVIILLMIRWRFHRLQKQMEDQIRSQGGQGGHSRSSYNTNPHSRRKPNEGEVRVHITSEAPEKRISEDVGDYVEFEETKEKK